MAAFIIFNIEIFKKMKTLICSSGLACILVFIISLAVIFTSCFFQSMHPLFTNEESLFDERLIGKWISIEKNNLDTWEFERYEHDTNQFKLTWTSTPISSFYQDSVWVYDTLKPVVLTFKVILGKLNHQLFMDIYPIKIKNDKDNNELALYLPMHTFAKLNINDDTLTKAFINYQWLEKGIEKKKFKIKYEKIEDDGIVLTASTKELQKFIAKYSNSKGAFDSPDAMIKQK